MLICSSFTRTLCRLDNLRKVVPHAERANTASFLEETRQYVLALQARVRELEAQLPPDQPRMLPAAPTAATGELCAM